MFSRFGLRFRMAASYVLVSAAAVLVVEGVLWAFVVPALRSADQNVARAEDRAELERTQGKAQQLTVQEAAALGTALSLRIARRPGRPPPDSELLETAAQLGFGHENSRPPTEVIEVLAGPDGRVVLSTQPAEVAVGSTLSAKAAAPAHRVASGAGGRLVAWGSSPLSVTSDGTSRHIGDVFVRVAALDKNPGSGAASAAPASTSDAGRWLWPGLVVLTLLVPVGLLFGLLSTRRLIRRIKRLADGTAAMAGGDLRSRIPVSSGDEVGRLEAGFNWMAERLDEAARAERTAVGSAARRAERERIARELHDSVSQGLFSASLLAGWLRRELPAGSEWHGEAESLEATLEQTMREMRAMLLELRPIELEDRGLAAALEELCRAFEVRLGIRVAAEIGALRLRPGAEHAVLRVVQEALGNAVRHGEPAAIDVRVMETDGHVVVLVRDDGRGFDLVTVDERRGLGLNLMRERVTELGGTFEVASVPAEGTTVRARIPAGAA
jgi:signal transduction histidine kinase